MTFSEALELIKVGKRVARSGWNGKGMFVFLVPGSRFTVNREPLLSILGEGTEVDYHGHIDMRCANGQIVPWLATQSDLLDEDWRDVTPSAHSYNPINGNCLRCEATREEIDDGLVPECDALSVLTMRNLQRGHRHAR